MKTLEECKRLDTSQLCREILKKDYVTLKATALTMTSTDVDMVVKFCFLHNDEEVKLENVGNNVFEAVFSRLKLHYESYASTQNLLMSYMSTCSSLSSKVLSGKQCMRVGIVNEVRETEFSTNNNSLVLAGYCSLLKVFQFYINCETAFLRLARHHSDGVRRNRQDVTSWSAYRMSKLTEFGRYDATKG